MYTYIAFIRSTVWTRYFQHENISWFLTYANDSARLRLLSRMLRLELTSPLWKSSRAKFGCRGWKSSHFLSSSRLNLRLVRNHLWLHLHRDRGSSADRWLCRNKMEGFGVIQVISGAGYWAGGRYRAMSCIEGTSRPTESKSKGKKGNEYRNLLRTWKHWWCVMNR